jgi:hypothetical protein
MSNSLQPVSFGDARRKLKVPKQVFNALLRSRLLGNYDPKGWLSPDGVEYYERYGTQWNTEVLEERMLSVEFVQSMPRPPGVEGGEQPPDTQTNMYIWSDDIPTDALETDTGWLAQFYLRPNKLFWPAPTAVGTIGPLPLKLAAPRRVREAALPTDLYPDPDGSLALITVTNIAGRMRPIKVAFETAYNIAVPILDELSAKYDLPLPIAHSLIVGIPSGLTNTSFPKIPKVKTIDRSEEIPAACPYPELRDAVALYREGISSNNAFHSFLALWKAYENANQVRADWRKQHRQNDVKVHSEVVPNFFAFSERKGLSFDQARQRLNRPYRVALTHAGDIEKVKLLTTASAEDLLNVSYQIPLVRYIASVTLENVRATLASTQGTQSG